MQNRRIGFHALNGGKHRLEDFVFNFDQLRRFFGNVSADRRHGGDGVPLVQSLSSGQDVHAQESKVVDGTLGQVNKLHGSLRPVSGGDHRVDSRMGSRSAGVHGFNHRVGVGAAKDLSVEHSGQNRICPVFSASGYFVGAVMTNRVGSDSVKFFIREDRIGLVLKHSLAPSC